MNKTCLLALLVLVSATGVSAADKDKDKDKNDSSTASSSDQQAAPKKDKLICRTNRATGSLLRVNRVCHTQAEWTQIAENARKNINDISRRENVGTETGTGNGMGGGGG